MDVEVGLNGNLSWVRLTDYATEGIVMRYAERELFGPVERERFVRCNA
ncbi:hypothetical protein GCM10009861_20510 [Neomicrococcus aestuarii]